MKWISDLIARLRGENKYPAYRSGWSSSGDSGPLWSQTISWSSDDSSSRKKKPKDKRIAKKPVDVYKELLTEMPKMDLVDLDNQISIVKRRVRMLEELGSPISDEHEALGFLQARKLLLKYKSEFKWQAATFEAVRNLCKKYKVVEVDFNGYYKTIPMEAIDELEKFMKAYTRVRKDKPVLKLIIDDAPAPGEKVSAERKKDPILLASSPFGRWWFVLGAWDKEVAIVDDLIYNGK